MYIHLGRDFLERPLVGGDKNKHLGLARRQAVFLNERRRVDRRTRLLFKHRVQAKGPRGKKHDDNRHEQNCADRDHEDEAPRLDKGKRRRDYHESAGVVDRAAHSRP